MAKRIYILSGGDRQEGFLTDELKELLKYDLKGKTNLVSIGAKEENEKNDIYFYGDKENLGIVNTFKFSDLTKFDLIDGRTKKEAGLKLLENADIIYLQGGDPLLQLKYIKDNKYDIFLRNYNGIILGLSAGSLNIAKKAFYSKDEDFIKSFFYDGLDLADITVDPHFDITDDTRVQEIKNASFEREIIGLPDYSAVVADENGRINYVGINYIFNNGKQN